jgi:hypothetical protein
MTNPRRPDDARLSTADLAQAGERAKEQRATEPTAPVRPAPATPPPRPPADRDVTAAQQARVIADNHAARTPASDHERPTPLFGGTESEEFRHRWQDIQTGFVDEPRQAVERADALVAAAIKRLAEIFAQERGTLEQQWAKGSDVSTEDLRVALRRYRGFFDRLLSV